jgi:hypothetical protein
MRGTVHRRVERGIEGQSAAPVVLEATRRQSEGEMKATESLVLALCVVLASCRDTALILEDSDAGDPEVQGLMRLADRPDRVLEGFSHLPTSGSVSLAKPSSFRSPEPGWERIVLSAHIQSYEHSRAWYSARSGGELRFMCETDVPQPQSCLVPEHRPRASILGIHQITYRTEFPCPGPGYHVEHIGSSGTHEVSLAEAKSIMGSRGLKDRTAS